MDAVTQSVLKCLLVPVVLAHHNLVAWNEGTALSNLLSERAWLGHQAEWSPVSERVVFPLVLIFFHCHRCFECSFLAWSACCYGLAIFHFPPMRHVNMERSGILVHLLLWFQKETVGMVGSHGPASCSQSAERSLWAVCTWGSHTLSTRNGLCY